MRKLYVAVLTILFCVSLFCGQAFAHDLPEGVTDKGSKTLTLFGTKPENLIFSVTMRFVPSKKPIINIFRVFYFTEIEGQYKITIPTHIFYPGIEYRLSNIIINATVKYAKETFETDLDQAANVFELSFFSEAELERRPSLREKAFFPDFPAELDLMCVERVFTMPDGPASLLDCTYEGKVQQSSRLPLKSLDRDAAMKLNFIITGQKNTD